MLYCFLCITFFLLFNVPNLRIRVFSAFLYPRKGWTNIPQYPPLTNHCAGSPEPGIKGVAQCHRWALVHAWASISSACLLYNNDFPVPTASNQIQISRPRISMVIACDSTFLIKSNSSSHDHGCFRNITFYSLQANSYHCGLGGMDVFWEMPEQFVANSNWVMKTCGSFISFCKLERIWGYHLF